MTKTTERLLNQGKEICIREEFSFIKLTVLGFKHIYSEYGEIGTIDVYDNTGYEEQFDDLYFNFTDTRNIGKLDRVINSGNYRMDLYQGLDIHHDICGDKYLDVIITPKDSIKLELSNGRHLIIFNEKGQLYDPNTETLYSIKESQRIMRFINKGGEYRSKRYRRFIEW